MSTSNLSFIELAFIKKKRFEKSATFLAILVLNVSILLLFAGTVICVGLITKEDQLPTVSHYVAPTPVPVSHRAKGGEGEKSIEESNPFIIPPSTDVSTIVERIRPNISFALQSTPLLSSIAAPGFKVPTGIGFDQGTIGGPTAQSDDIGDNATSMGGPGLVGELYDLKQTPDGSPTPIAIVAPETADKLCSTWLNLPATAAGLKVLREYVQHWNQDILDRYYKAPTTLETAQIFIPMRRSEEATKAFGVADKVTARRWVIHYHGTITPPAGQFRFLGYGDDFLVVRVGDRNVLDGSIRSEWLDQSANGAKQETVPGPNGHGLYCGRWFDTDPGVPVSIDILIGEGPGGSSGFTLLIQKQGDTATPGDYPVFQVAPRTIPQLSKVTSGFSGKTLLFPAQ